MKVKELVAALSDKKINPEAQVLLEVGGDGAVHPSWEVHVVQEPGVVRITSERP